MATSGSVEISLVQMALGLAPVAAAMFISFRHKLNLTKPLLIASVRGAVQLTLIGYVLVWIFKLDNPWLISAFITFMVAAAAQAGTRRIKGLQTAAARRTYQKILFIAIFLSSVCVVGYLQFVVVRPEPLWEGRYIIPLGGMLIAQAMTASALAIDRYRSELQLRAGEIETLLALGATASQASESTMRAAAAAAMMPSINTLAVLGIVALPGMMSGQILAGESPLNAVRYQLLICFCIASTASIVAWIAIRMTQSRYFNKADQFLLREIMAAEKVKKA